ncbi:Uncharacterised protein [Vibrio cholerae]|nr:Uncharacterised protein [Vibrio cholerae]
MLCNRTTSSAPFTSSNVSSNSSHKCPTESFFCSALEIKSFRTPDRVDFSASSKDLLSQTTRCLARINAATDQIKKNRATPHKITTNKALNCSGV